ncbi:hypothetical protein ILUMI_11959 [Ignelater luminosus]|uniref:Uncharacterized protein n=1 Tax=Ignelater luminosus TaxID=2038154 RepID=A0A8K0CXG2_IGNLU|nr:hypothetical protein ILUMI_11959 [Ignelater luminosus]
MKISVFYFLMLVLLVQAKQDVSEELVQYYLKLYRDFKNETSQWEAPTDNRKFFQPDDEEADPVDHGHYDFIIVGAGVAGSVLANKLTESGKFKVLLLEAGGRENDLTGVPGFLTDLTTSDFNWGYKVKQEKNSCLGMKSRHCLYHKGKVVGGSSVLTFNMYIRGDRKAFDKWGSKNPGWDYESVLPYFKKSENSTLRQEDPGYHGHNGPVSVEDCRHYHDGTEAFLKAAKQRGRKLLDYNGRNQTGYSTMQNLTKKGRRCSANDAFIKPAMNRKNLEILDHALGTKILIKSKLAHGVEFIRDRKKYKATVSKEVIISGGGINSPQILMVSGIGPKQHLEELGIPVVQDLPVGKTFYDQHCYPALMFSTNISANKPDLEQYIRDYLKGFGPLTLGMGMTSVGFENGNVEYPFASLWGVEAVDFLSNFLGITDENCKAILEPIMDKYLWTVFPVPFEQKTNGNVKLKTKDPLDYPIIYSNLYSDEHGEDIRRMVAAIKDVFEISKTPAFQSIGSKYESDPLPACKHHDHLSSGYWTCAVKQLTVPIYQGVAACKMGPKDDKTAVVDNELKVHGMDGLRVVDASVIPLSFTHAAATVYMMAEKVAPLIRGEYGDL